MHPDAGSVAQISLRSSFPFSRTDLSHALRDGCSERCEAVQDRRTDLQLCNLADEVASADAFAEQLEAVHLGFDEATPVVSAPSSPDRPAEAAGGAENVVAGLGTGRILFPGSVVAAGRNDCDGVSCGDGFMTGPRVISAVCTDLADGLVIGDLLQHLGQHGRIDDSRSGHFDGADFQRFCINSKVNLAPLTRLRWPVFLGAPFAIAFRFDPCAVDQQVQGTGALAIGNSKVQPFLTAAERAEVRHRPIQSGQSSGKSPPDCFLGAVDI